MLWDKEKIKKVLPQREPFIFIDEVTEIEKGRIVAKKYIDPEDYFLKGHFPGRPIMPGALIVESMAQAGIILYSVVKPEISEAKPHYYLAKVKAEFMRPVYPGDTLILEARDIKILDYAGMIEARANVGGEVAASAVISFAVKRKDGK